jgi:16S rRNA (cytosine(1402)-N(4))-methyltransferase
MPLLEIKDLKLDFGSGAEALRAVDGVSLTIGAGETVCLVGESGCGKSITALSIARLVPAPPANYAGGEILLNGRDVLKMSKGELRKIRGGMVSYVFQEPGAALNPVFRVGSQIKESLKLHRRDLTGRAGSPLPAARSDTIDGAHGLSRHSRATAEVTRPTGADIILADLGVSSMQIDDPARGFSVKLDGPLDMRMNPRRGQPASALLEKIKPAAFVEMLVENADEPHAAVLAPALAGKKIATTATLAQAIRAALPRLNEEDGDLSIRRVFQALRIAVNDEFSALDTFLRHLPACLNPGGRVAILTFHSGEDRRVKKVFANGLRDGLYAGIAPEVIRPTADERHANPRSAPAKLRWARRAS